jgi:hypothetical protein
LDSAITVCLAPKLSISGGSSELLLVDYRQLMDICCRLDVSLFNSEAKIQFSVKGNVMVSMPKKRQKLLVLNPINNLTTASFMAEHVRQIH